MGYTRKWVPPSIPLRNDLAAWKAICQDIHDAILLAGLTQTATAGQLVISGVATLPADGSFAGFCEYAFADALQATAPVIIKLEFGCGAEGLESSGGPYSRSRTLRIRGTVTFKGVSSRAFQWPQEVNSTGSITTQLTDYGTSFLAYDGTKGFLGFVYGAGSRNKPFPNDAGSYYGSSLTLFVQRTTASNGTPNGDGLAIYSPSMPSSNASTLWAAGVIPPAYSQYITTGGAAAESIHMAVRVGANEAPTIGGQINAQEVYYGAPAIKAFPWLFTYVASGLPAGSEFSVEVFPGSTHNFVALGNETGIGVDAIIGQRGAIAMLFE